MKPLNLLPVLLMLALLSCKSGFNPKWAREQAPDVFRARFETTQGPFDIEAYREWSPQGVDRLFQLIKSGYYTDMAIFRVVPDFVAQFGISNDSALYKAWSGIKIDDEPVIESNLKGTIAFARSGQRTRTTQIFINLRDNTRLDNIEGRGVTGFPVIARVSSGMDVVEKFYNGYGDRAGIRQDSIQTYGNAYLKRHYGKIDYIHKAYLIK